MKKLALFALAGGFSMFVGCARPGEIGWTPTLTASERGQEMSRNIDMEGKMSQDDLDNILMLRPMSGLSAWRIR